MLNGLAAQQMDFAIWQYLASPHMSSGHIKSGPAFGFALGSWHLVSLFGVVLQRPL